MGKIIVLVGYALFLSVPAQAQNAAPIQKLRALALDPLPPALHPLRLAQPDGSDADEVRTHNMIAKRLDIQRLTEYVAELSKLQEQRPTEQRAERLQEYQGFLEDTQRTMDGLEQNVPQERRVARVEQSFEQTEEELIVRTTATFGDGSTRVEIRRIPKER